MGDEKTDTNDDEDIIVAQEEKTRRIEAKKTSERERKRRADEDRRKSMERETRAKESENSFKCASKDCTNTIVQGGSCYLEPKKYPRYDSNMENELMVTEFPSTPDQKRWYGGKVRKVYVRPTKNGKTYGNDYWYAEKYLYCPSCKP